MASYTVFGSCRTDARVRAGAGAGAGAHAGAGTSGSGVADSGAHTRSVGGTGPCCELIFLRSLRLMASYTVFGSCRCPRSCGCWGGCWSGCLCWCWCVTLPFTSSSPCWRSCSCSLVHHCQTKRDIVLLMAFSSFFFDMYVSLAELNESCSASIVTRDMLFSVKLNFSTTTTKWLPHKSAMAPPTR